MRINQLWTVLLPLTAALLGCEAGDVFIMRADPPPTVTPDPPVFQPTGEVEELPFTIEPADIELKVTGYGTADTHTFVAKRGGTPVVAHWTLSHYDIGEINENGRFSARGIVAGDVEVIATFGSAVAKAHVRVTVELDERILTGNRAPDPTNVDLLAGPTEEESAEQRTEVLYPYAGTVMPRGLVAPVLQISRGEFDGEDVKIALDAEGFNWRGYYAVTDAEKPRFELPQHVWDAAVRSAGNGRLDISITKAAGGKAYGPARTHVQVAPGSLRGAVYYMTYEDERNGLWVAHPGRKEPAKQLVSGCVVCHSSPANGKWLSVGADWDDPQASGIYRIAADASLEKTDDMPEGLGGDSRGFSFAAFTPDGKYVTRSQNDFWGGVNQLGWRVSENGTLSPATLIGLGPDVSALLPTFSPDGLRYAFTTGPGDASGATPSRSVNVMDVDVDEASDTLLFTNRRTVIDNQQDGEIAKYVSFLPDSDFLVLQQGDAAEAHDGMLPTRLGEEDYGAASGKLYLHDIKNDRTLSLNHANRGNDAADEHKNFEPFALPAAAAGYYWVAFTSIREYGNTYTGDEKRKQLWVTAINPDAAPGEDPSSPPFYLPNQSDTKNERGFWVLESCKQTSEVCAFQEDCCSGICSPSNDGSGLKTCRPPEDRCVPTGEGCAVTADCCAANDGIICHHGLCGEGPIL